MSTTWNPADKAANVVLSNGNRTMTATGDSLGVRSTTPHSVVDAPYLDNFYWEIHVDVDTAGTGIFNAIGLGTSIMPIDPWTFQLGDGQRRAIVADGELDIMNAGPAYQFFNKWGAGMVWSCAVSLSTNLFVLWANGDLAFAYNSVVLPFDYLYAFAAIETGSQLTCAFAASEQVYSPPLGFVDWDHTLTASYSDPRAEMPGRMRAAGAYAWRRSQIGLRRGLAFYGNANADGWGDKDKQERTVWHDYMFEDLMLKSEPNTFGA